MSNSEKRAMDLAQRIVDAFAAVDQPTRNARSMLLDAAVWTNIATAIVAVVEGTDSIRTEPEKVEKVDATVDAAEAEVEDTGELDDDENPKKKKGRKY
jgi:ActR/RegA family two-component response regulator